ncbi:hypothetical protein GM415_12995 [Pseudodesulfovibrio cashew]|uniref:Uncharacterized protein n=1 Tax=Pseudodesulfovibrio cashew TaxID=2678688 RepID=A0A6I6JL51_9BACT|nr:hypothetical protein [Pseudodesulfovibrio cashew]QGY41003.1 hypothetical protein GM415_12995 [Pseudodesulfovibrio cashew]
MRIRDSGSHFFGSGGGNDRSDSFKKGRKKGQKVRGTLVKRVSPELAWVDIEGHKLLAQLPFSPSEGGTLTFLIRQLEPEIILKAIFEPSSAGISALNLAGHFDTARTLFENRLRKHYGALSEDRIQDRLEAFLYCAREDAALLPALLDATRCLEAINSVLDRADGRFHYLPWLIPSARRHVAFVPRQKSSSQLVQPTYEFELTGFGMVRVEFISRPPDMAYKVRLQHPARSEALKRYLSSRDRSGFTGGLECLGVSHLPRRNHGGLIAERMFGQG